MFKTAATTDFQHCGICDQQLAFLSLKSCTGSSETTFAKCHIVGNPWCGPNVFVYIYESVLIAQHIRRQINPLIRRGFHCLHALSMNQSGYNKPHLMTVCLYELLWWAHEYQRITPTDFCRDFILPTLVSGSDVSVSGISINTRFNGKMSKEKRVSRRRL